MPSLKITGGRATPEYSWVIFGVGLSVCSELLRWEPLSGVYQVPYLVLIGNFAVLGCYLLVAAVSSYWVLRRLCSVLSTTRLGAAAIQIPPAVVFAWVMALWLNVLRRLAGSLVPTIPHLRERYALLAFFLVGVGVFAVRRRAGSDPVRAGRRLVAIMSGAIVVSLVIISAAYLALSGRSRSECGTLGAALMGRARPNIIIVLLDGVVSSEMSRFGYRLPTTPRIDSLTKGWTSYPNAQSAGTSTLTALPTILTGRYPYDLHYYRYGDVAACRDGWLSLAGLLRGLGYETVYVQGGGHPVGLYHFERDWDEVLRVGRGWFYSRDLTVLDPRLALALWSWLVPPSVFILEYITPSVALPGSRGIVEPMYHLAEAWFERRAREDDRRPFFVYMHMHRPHGPYARGELEGVLTGQAGAGRAHVDPLSTVAETPRLRYDENIWKADQEFGELLDTIRSSGFYDNSLIILTSDHGDRLDITDNQSGLITEQEHTVPLLVKYPNQTLGVTDARLASPVDIVPTVLDLLGVGRMAPSWSDGRSLLEAAAEPGRVIYVRRADNPMLLMAMDSRRRLNSSFPSHDQCTTSNGLLAPPADSLACLALTHAVSTFRLRASQVSAGGSILKAAGLKGQP